MSSDHPSSIRGLHHVAIICSNYAASRRFYHEVLGFAIIREVYRAERDSHKCDLLIPGADGHGGGVQIELFSFPNPPIRVSGPEARGLRHLALAVDDMEGEVARLSAHGISVEPIRVDPATGARYTFFPDPDGLPIELYEQR
jgi:glyoxylase I family protein